MVLAGTGLAGADFARKHFQHTRISVSESPCAGGVGSIIGRDRDFFFAGLSSRDSQREAGRRGCVYFMGYSPRDLRGLIVRPCVEENKCNLRPVREAAARGARAARRRRVPPRTAGATPH